MSHKPVNKITQYIAYLMIIYYHNYYNIPHNSNQFAII